MRIKKKELLIKEKGDCWELEELRWLFKIL